MEIEELLAKLEDMSINLSTINNMYNKYMTTDYIRNIQYILKPTNLETIINLTRQVEISSDGRLTGNIIESPFIQSELIEEYKKHHKLEDRFKPSLQILITKVLKNYDETDRKFIMQNLYSYCSYNSMLYGVINAYNAYLIDLDETNRLLVLSIENIDLNNIFTKIRAFLKTYPILLSHYTFSNVDKLDDNLCWGNGISHTKPNNALYGSNTDFKVNNTKHLVESLFYTKKNFYITRQVIEDGIVYFETSEEKLIPYVDFKKEALELLKEYNEMIVKELDKVLSYSKDIGERKCENLGDLLVILHKHGIKKETK